MKDLLANPATWIVLTAISELIGLSKLKSNSIVSALKDAIMSMKPSNSDTET
tara:strand:+ start:351 stop:506 length:156 start_codon:yes stop_codon:yes gene_type:complete